MKKAVDQILDEAADLFVTGEKKWIQNQAADEDGGACMAQAMWLAAGCRGNQIGSEEIGDFARARQFVVDDLVQELPKLQYVAGAVAEWNDDPARTENEVVDKLRGLAKEYREKTQGAAADD